MLCETHQTAGRLEEVVDTSFEKIAQHLASTSETTAADMRPTQQRYQETMEKLVGAQQAGVHQVTAWPHRWWIERDNDDTAVEPKYLLFTNRKLLGHSYWSAHVLTEERAEDLSRAWSILTTRTFSQRLPG